MKNNIKPLCKFSVVLFIGFALSACQSTPDKPQGASVINGQHIDEIATNLKILMEKQQQHDELLKEWQQLKPALSRLAVVEEELSLLIDQLDQYVATSATATSTTNVPPQPKAAPVKTSGDTAAAAISSSEDTTSANDVDNNISGDKRFALQITSLSDPIRLPVVWQQLKQKHPEELSDLEPNFEKIKVGDTDYYRLKVGAFATKQQAASRCSAIKSLSINCLVTNYVASDFSALPTL